MTTALPDTSQYLPTMANFDALFKDKGGSTAYLNNMLGMKNAAGSPTATPERVLTDDEKKHGSYGTVNDIGNVNLSDVASVTEMAKRGGWADPNAFSLDMITAPDMSVTHNEGGSRYTNPYVQFKDPASRGITNTGRNLNQVQVLYDDQGQNYGTEGSPITGYKVLAGAVPGTKNHTSLFYQYDKDGKFQGANFDMEERGLEGAAPLAQIAMMAIGAGAFGGIGGIGKALAPGLGTTGQMMVGGAATGGSSALLTGQDPVKGALTGGVGAGLSAINPAGMAGITNPTLGKFVNNAVSKTATAAINGGSTKDALTDALFASVTPPTMANMTKIFKK